jgi:hypothetical protein
MKKILTEAAVVGDATARAVSFYMPEKEAFYFDNSYWQLPFIGGYQFQTQPGVLNLNAYIYYYFMATGVTPAMEEKMVGKGSQYAWTARDARGEALDDPDRSTLPQRQQLYQGSSNQSRRLG